MNTNEPNTNLNISSSIMFPVRVYKPGLKTAWHTFLTLKGIEAWERLGARVERKP